MEQRSVMTMSLLLLLSALALSVAAGAAPLFYESFEETWEGRWIPSEKSEYEGTWKHAASKGHDDYGLLVSEEARKYAIGIEMPEKVALGDGTVVLQFEVRLQNGLQCGGAYLKFLQPQEKGWKLSQLDNSSPYTIMFGPDKCGSTNKVHFIFRHKNHKTGEVLEHHLAKPPTVPYDELTHVYTAVIYPNHTVSILLDGEVKNTADLLSKDFEPAVVPPATIPDPEDKKPEDWDERAKIPDPEAKKPEDWDEEAPRMIEDEEAVKPEGWLDDEPDQVEDSSAVKPEDWDDEEDGAWEAPLVPNPKCAEAPGCGVWKKPMTKNPAYKGKWHAPMIENPAYKGKWKPQEIPNPDYFELEKPALEPISAVAIEIWTMQSGILFDNVLIATDEKVGEAYRDDKWKPKFEAEEKAKKEEAEKARQEAASADEEEDDDEEGLPFKSDAPEADIPDFSADDDFHDEL